MHPMPDAADRPDDLPSPRAPWPYPLWLAHRGAGRLAPENTLAALRVGAAHGWRAFEVDVKLSADGLPFLLHDDSFDRTTDAAGSAGELNWADVARLDAGSWHSRHYAGEPPASLEAVAAFCLRNGLQLNLELKPVPGDEPRTGAVVARCVRQLWGAAVHAGQATWPLLSSFSPEALAAARETEAELPRALLLDRFWTDWLPVAERLECRAIGLHHALIDAALMQRLDADDLRVLAYTVNDAAEAERLLELGVDSLVSDAIELFCPALGAEQSLP
ncbi:MAG: glycerophosphodiester phosphodiesterase [Pseudomonadota bacterium]